MNVAPRYLGRGSWLARRDPRVLILALAAYVFAVVQVWDLRILVPMAAVAVSYYASARIPFHAVRWQWSYALVIIGILILFNTLLTGRPITL
jgi:energy-coupling factor transport system permease protein